MEICNVVIENENSDFPSMSEKEIIIQAVIAEQEIKLGKTLSHDDAFQEFKKWK